MNGDSIKLALDKQVQMVHRHSPSSSGSLPVETTASSMQKRFCFKKKQETTTHRRLGGVTFTTNPSLSKQLYLCMYVCMYEKIVRNVVCRFPPLLTN